MPEHEGVLVLGVTGPIGCGKSTVSRLTVELGALDHVDADMVTREVMSEGSQLSRRIMSLFPGCEADGAIDRRRLGRIVFDDPAALRRLESLVHPEVRSAIAGRIEKLRSAHPGGVVTVEAIRLLQSPLADDADIIWLVMCDRVAQRQRLRFQRGLAPDEAEQRMASSPSFNDPRVSRIIVNDGSPADLRHEVKRAWQETFGAAT